MFYEKVTKIEYIKSIWEIVKEKLSKRLFCLEILGPKKRV